MTDTDKLMRLMRIVVTTIEGLRSEQVAQLIAGEAKLTFNASKASKDTKSRLPVDQANILAKLNECKDRDEARNILDAIPNRDALAAFARSLKVHVVKHDRREDIESKIIEFMIGGKLRTEAIRTLNLKGGGGRRSDEGSNDNH